MKPSKRKHRTSKKNLYYNATVSLLSKCLLIAIRKAFDTVDRQILKQIIYNFEEQSPKIILLDILAIYECITL